MRREEAGFLLALAPSLLQVGSLTWAGARASSRGTQLLRDGAVSRLVVGRDHVQAQVRDGEWPEQATLSVYNGIWRAACSCGLAPCAHAVAVLLFAQREARDLQRAGQQRDDVLSTLRQRLQAPNAREPQSSRILSDIERLPLPAAVDMVALGWRQNQRPTAVDAKPFVWLAERLVELAAAEPQLARELALRLWAALAARKVVFTPLPVEAEQAAQRLGPVVAGLAGSDAPNSDQLALLVDLSLTGSQLLAALGATAVESLLMRQPELQGPLLAMVSDWLMAHRPEWKEVAQPGGRDRLVSALCSAALAAGDLSAAAGLAMRWPPLRSVLLALVEALAHAGRLDEAQRLADHFSPRDETWQAVQLAAMDGAVRGGQANAAARICALAIDVVPGPVWLDALSRVVPVAEWPQVRAKQVEALVQRDDPPWLPAWLLSQRDGLAAIAAAANVAPTRERLFRAAVAALQEPRPLQAFALRARHITALAQQPATAAKQLKDELLQLQESAAQLGEPGLAADYIRLLGRELGDVPVVSTAVAAALRSGRSGSPPPA